QRAAVGVKARGSIPDVHERVLDRVLGTTRVAEHADGHAIGEACVAVVQLGERLMVAGREPRGELLIAARGYDLVASDRRPVNSPTGDFLGGLIAHSSFSINRHAQSGLRRTRSTTPWRSCSRRRNACARP